MNGELKNLEELLLRYEANELSPEELKNLELQLSQSPELKKKADQYLLIHQFLQTRGKIESPSRFFTEKVMDGLETKSLTIHSSPRKGMMLLLGIILASGLVISLLSSGTFNNLTETIPTDYLKAPNFLKIPASVSVDIKLVINVILLTNLAIAFVVLDRTVLRPFFQKKLYQ